MRTIFILQVQRRRPGRADEPNRQNRKDLNSQPVSTGKKFIRRFISFQRRSFNYSVPILIMIARRCCHFVTPSKPGSHTQVSKLTSAVLFPLTYQQLYHLKGFVESFQLK